MLMEAFQIISVHVSEMFIVGEVKDCYLCKM